MTQRDVNSLLESSRTPADVYLDEIERLQAGPMCKMNSHIVATVEKRDYQIAILQNELAELRKIKEAAEAWSQRQPTCCADDPGAACDRHCASEILAGRGPTP